MSDTICPKCGKSEGKCRYRHYDICDKCGSIAPRGDGEYLKGGFKCEHCGQVWRWIALDASTKRR